MVRGLRRNPAMLPFARLARHQGLSPPRPAGRRQYPYYRVEPAATLLHAAARNRRRTRSPEMGPAVPVEAPERRDTALPPGASEHQSYTARGHLAPEPRLGEAPVAQ